MMHPAFTMPIHPTLKHPLSGLALRAVGFRRDGRAIWPIIGAADDGGAGGDSGDSAGGDAGGAGGDSGDAGTGAGDSGSAGDAGGKADDKAGKTDDGPKKPEGYPEGKSIAEMSVAERAVYFEHKSRVEENRRKELLNTTGGKFGDALKSDLEELARLRTERMTDSEKAVEQAKAATRAEVATEYATKLAAAEFKAALAHVDEERRGQIIEGVALDKFLTPDGDVDTAKVKSHVAAIAPPDQGTGRRDYGAGRHSSGATPSGVAAGAEMFAAKRSKSTTS